MKKLSESVWGDIRKKSLGQEEREENAINRMNRDEFNDYLNGLYDGYIRISYNEQSQVEGINIHFANSKNHNPGVFSNWPVGLTYYTDRGMLSFSNKKFDDLCPHLYHELMRILNIEPDEEGYKFIVPDDNKKVDNQFVLYVLETIIEHLDPNEEEITIFKK